MVYKVVLSGAKTVTDVSIKGLVVVWYKTDVVEDKKVV